MAQPVLENGDPLQEYLRESGDAPEVMPGDLAQDNGHSDSWPLRILRILTQLHFHHHTNSFADRFKHDVISSSLLSSTPFATPLSHHHRSESPLPALPGTLHSRDPSATTQDVHPLAHQSNKRLPTDSYNYGLASIAFVLAVVIFAAGYYTLTALLLGGTFYLIQFYHNPTVENQTLNISPNMEALNDLISAGSMWDSTVHEAITLLESEERSIFYGPSTPLSPSSSLRVTLQSSLHTTQTQCDHIRALFSALTLPEELSQLSEMYAPPSPMKPTFLSGGMDHPRPLSLPGRKRALSVSPTKPDTKRFTWNGSVEGGVTMGSATMQATMRRKEKRRSDLSASSVFGGPEDPEDLAGSKSAPVTPLNGVQEEEGEEASSFGVDALSLQRKHKRDGLGVLGVPPSILTPPHRKSASNSTSTLGTPSSASKFTTMQTTRHPLSLSALHHTLQSAISSKRYACSHLLALRFDGEEGGEDEGYWEDVRSVMGLLTGTLGDAASRLVEAIEEAEERRKLEQNPTPKSALGDIEREREGSLSPSPMEKKKEDRTVRSMTQMVSFAPMPSHLTRFAAHVDAISSAMNDARDNLEQCVTSLREDTRPSQEEEDPALLAYERLRRELGLALRECERGRERLLDLIAASNPSPGSEEEDELHDLPALGQDIGGSDESDKPDSHSPMLDFERFNGEDTGITVVSGEGLPDDDVDDASAHLLRMASSKHLPPQGIEQVFEAEPEPAVAFTREKSKLTREERIKMTKARRESGQGLALSPSSGDTAPPRRESWGPGGDVVQELKDVIWQVGEKRRRMSAQLETAP